MARVVFMGSPDFAVPILRKLAVQHDMVGVVTQPDRGAGRGRALKPPPVKLAAQKLGLEVIQPVKMRGTEATLQLGIWAPDLIVVAAFGQILRSDVLALPAHGCLNVHASLLPRWRGASPVQAAILAGDAETGATVMRMNEGLDTGGLLSQRRIPIEPTDTSATLTEKLSALGAELLIETIPAYLSGRLQPQAQDEQRATTAPRLRKEDGLLDLTRPAAELERRVRAFNPWPGAYFTMDGHPLKVLRAHVEAGEAAAGKRMVSDGQVAVGTSNGILVLDEVQPEGKKPMSGRAFLAGARNWWN